MKKSTILIIAIIYSLILFSGHLIWNHHTGPVDHAKVKNGELVLEEDVLNSKDYINLNGEWDFYPNELLMPDQIDKNDQFNQVAVPGSWINSGLESGTAIGYGTYSLKVTVEELTGELIGLRVNNINNASKIYVNGDLVSNLGNVATNKSEEIADKRPVTFTFRATDPVIDIVIQASNFNYNNVGGMTETILLGKSEAIHTYTNRNKMLQVIAITVLIIHIVYALILTSVSIYRRQALYFAFLLVFLTLTILFDDDVLILSVIDLNHNMLTRLKAFFYSGTAFFTLLFIIEALKKRGVKTRLVTYLLLFNGITIIGQLILPVNFYRDHIIIYIVLWIATIFATLYLVLKQLKYENSSNIILLVITSMSILMSIVWGGIKNGLELDILYYPFDIIITVIVFALYLFLKVIRIFKKNLSIESALLQAQMQPHFIFNTLNSIMSLSYIDQERMVKLLRNFSKYLRYSFREINLNKVIDINDEIEIVTAYVAIQQERFIGRIKVEWEIDEFTSEKIPPLTIQPLVENVIKHGILSEYESGKVTIKVKQQEADIYVEVSDNGQGMSAKEVENLLTKSSNIPKGIGLQNTNERLLYQYGKGLCIESAPGEGFKVSFTIPKKDKRQRKKWVKDIRASINKKRI